MHWQDSKYNSEHKSARLSLLHKSKTAEYSWFEIHKFQLEEAKLISWKKRIYK